MFDSGKLEVGCNYWASHAGIFMWQKWDENVVRKDLETLAANGIKLMRVFPLWPDFQPLKRLYSGNAFPRELRMGENPLDNTTEFGRAGMDPVMMERFRTFADIAEENGLRLIVGLVTGWMSGRYFCPPAFERQSALTDPEVMMWEVRFVRTFVRTMKDHKAISSWDLGNECNCMAHVENNRQAWLWTNTISSAIKLEDPSRPVVSGMHSLQLSPEQCWLIADQSELTDVLTTHPYPLFTPHCSKAAFNELPGTLHATAETQLYADISGKPAFVEEAGSLGPFIASDSRTAEYIRCTAASAWAHDLRAFLWWCAFDQGHLTEAPYDWVALERELGLLTGDHVVKPQLKALKEVSDRIDALPFDKLPPRRVDAVCLLPVQGSEQWKTAFGVSLLAKQAGYDVKFAWCKELPIPESDVYLLPSIQTTWCIPAHVYRELLKQVENGAKLLVTSCGGMLQPFADVFGCRVDYSHLTPEVREITMDGETFHCASEWTSRLLAEKCTVLATLADGSPVFTRCAYGKGEVFFLNAPIEEEMVERRAVMAPFYRKFFTLAGVKRRITEKDDFIGVTEHPMDDKLVIVLINYSSKAGSAVIDGRKVTIPGNDFAVEIVAK